MFSPLWRQCRCWTPLAAVHEYNHDHVCVSLCVYAHSSTSFYAFFVLSCFNFFTFDLFCKLSQSSFFFKNTNIYIKYYNHPLHITKTVSYCPLFSKAEDTESEIQKKMFRVQKFHLNTSLAVKSWYTLLHVCVMCQDSIMHHFPWFVTVI